MKKIAKRLLCGILAAVLVSGTVAVMPAHAENAQEEGAAQTAMDVWVQNSADRAFASSQMPRQAEQEIKLYAAKNEYEAAQILVRSSEGLNNLSLQASMLIGENGAEIAASNIVIYREYSSEAKVGGDVEATPDGSDLCWNVIRNFWAVSMYLRWTSRLRLRKIRPQTGITVQFVRYIRKRSVTKRITVLPRG